MDDDDQRRPRNLAEVEDHAGPLWAVILIVGAWGLSTVGVPTKASLVILGIAFVIYCVALSRKYPDAMGHTGWARWHAERRAWRDRR